MKFIIAAHKLKPLVSDLFGTSGEATPLVDGVNSPPLFLFECAGNILTIFAADGIQQQHRSIEASGKIESPQSFTLLAKSLAGICTNLEDDTDIQVEIKDGKGTLSAGYAEYKLDAATEGAKFNKMEANAPEKTIKIVEKHIKHILEQTRFATAQNDARPYLNGVLFEANPQCIRCVATDGHRLAKCELKNETFKGDETLKAILPNKTIDEMIRMLEHGDSVAEVVIGDKHIDIKTERFALSSNLLEMQYPDWESVIPEGHTLRLEVDKSGLQAGIQRAMAIAESPEDAISLECKGDKVFLTHRNARTNEEASANTGVKVKGDPFVISFNAKYLADVAMACASDTLVMDLADPSKAAKFYDKKAPESLFLIMPIKL